MDQPVEQVTKKRQRYPACLHEVRNLARALRAVALPEEFGAGESRAEEPHPGALLAPRQPSCRLGVVIAFNDERTRRCIEAVANLEMVGMLAQQQIERMM